MIIAMMMTLPAAKIFDNIKLMTRRDRERKTKELVLRSLCDRFRGREGHFPKFISMVDIVHVAVTPHV